MVVVHGLSSSEGTWDLPGLWTVAWQVPLSVGFSREECWSGLPFPSPGDLPDPGIEASSLHVSCIGRILYHEPLWKPHKLLKWKLVHRK